MKSNTHLNVAKSVKKLWTAAKGTTWVSVRQKTRRSCWALKRFQKNFWHSLFSRPMCTYFGHFLSNPPSKSRDSLVIFFFKRFSVYSWGITSGFVHGVQSPCTITRPKRSIQQQSTFVKGFTCLWRRTIPALNPQNNHTLDRGSIRSSLRDGLSTPYRMTKEQCWTVALCPYPHCIEDILIIVQ